MNVRKLLICLIIGVFLLQISVFAEETQSETNTTNNDLSIIDPLNDNTSNDNTSDDNTSELSSQDDLTGDIDDTNLSENEEIVDSEQTELLPEFDYSGQKELPAGYERYIALALDKKNMPIDILINGSYLKTDTDALLINNTTYVPLRAIFVALGYKDIKFDASTYKATAIGQLGNFEFLLNSNEVYINEKLVQMDQPSLMVNGRTMVPVRFISEYFKFNIAWDPFYSTVNLVNTTFAVNTASLNGRFYSYDEFTTFAKLIMKEAGGTSYETKHAVASVVMNQVRHPGLPNTINGVIFAVSRSAHFPPAHKAGFLDTVPNKECIMAAKMTLRGENSVGPCIYFNTRPFKGKTVYKVSDGVYFCY